MTTFDGLAQERKDQALSMTPVSRHKDRDRFVAFAFAAADLLIDLDESQNINGVLGASSSVTGRPQDEIIGRNFDELIAPADRAMVRHLVSRIPIAGGRMEPVTIRLSRKQGSEPIVILGGCRMPTLDGIFVTLTLTAPITKPKAEASRDEKTGLLDEKSLVAFAHAFSSGETGAPSAHLTLVRMEGLDDLQNNLPEGQKRRVLDEVSAVLRASSMGGDAAGQISGDVFGLIQSGLAGTEALVLDLKEAVNNAGVAHDLLRPILSTIDLAADGLSDSDIERSLAHAVKHFLEPSAKRPPKSNLKKELAAAVAAAMAEVAELRKCITRNQISLVYQPIVSLHDRNIHHYEALARKPDGTSAYNTIAFSEEVGLIAEVDLMILRMALHEISQTNGPPIAVNISGKSVQDLVFRDQLVAILEGVVIRRERLIFELTETSEVEKINEVANFLKWLRRRGHRVCLDDFGSGAAAYSYLRNFEVDFVKIDGPFLHAAIEKGRDRALVASVVKLCNELGCKTVGEMIETEKQAEMAAALGISHGQGWLFGKPIAIIPEEPVVPLRLVRRQGAKESWG